MPFKSSCVWVQNSEMSGVGGRDLEIVSNKS